MGCQPENPDGFPPHISALDSLIVLPDGGNPSENIKLSREIAFNDSLLFEKVTAMKADRYGNVYIAGESWNRRQIYTFDRNGTKIDSLGMHGSGFGQFLELSSLQLKNSNLHIFDHQLGRVTTYNTDLREITDTTVFGFDGDHLPAEWPGFRSFPVAVMNDNSYLAAFQRTREPAYEPEGEIRYYKAAASGKLMPGKFHSQPDIKYLVGDYAGRPAHFALSHPEQPLLEISENGRIYSAFTDEFLIHVLDKNGEKMHSYFYPAKRLDLDPAEVIHPRFSHNDQLLRVRESAEYPDKWPALFSLLSDDENRIWVSAITENRAELKWYVIDDATGEIASTFRWPFDKPISFVRGGTVYTIEKDDMGFEQVVRYGIKVLP
jgi:hypothetical protein